MKYCVCIIIIITFSWFSHHLVVVYVGEVGHWLDIIVLHRWCWLWWVGLGSLGYRTYKYSRARKFKWLCFVDYICWNWKFLLPLPDKWGSTLWWGFIYLCFYSNCHQWWWFYLVKLCKVTFILLSLSLTDTILFRFVLDCRLLGGDPLPSYSWFKDGSLLTPEMILEDQGLDLVSDREHSQLDFLDPAPHHEGYYHCEANNTLGKINKQLNDAV